MNKQVLVPDIGDFEKVEIIEVLVKPGDNIKKNDSLITLESDKSSVEVPSTEEGKNEQVYGAYVLLIECFMHHTRKSLDRMCIDIGHVFLWINLSSLSLEIFADKRLI